jgi:hypothetical protein
MNRPGRPPTVTPRPKQTFGPWTVIEAGIRAWQTAKYPNGTLAALCECSCGTTRLQRVSRLPGLAADGPDCQHRKRGRKPSAEAAARREAREARTRARHAVPDGWNDTSPGPPLPERRARPSRSAKSGRVRRSAGGGWSATTAVTAAGLPSRSSA